MPMCSWTLQRSLRLAGPWRSSPSCLWPKTQMHSTTWAQHSTRKPQEQEGQERVTGKHARKTSDEEESATDGPAIHEREPTEHAQEKRFEHSAEVLTTLGAGHIVQVRVGGADDRAKPRTARLRAGYG